LFFCLSVCGLIQLLVGCRHQLLFFYHCSYIGYGKDQLEAGSSPKEESLLAIISLVQSVLLGSFAAILAAHRSEILDKPGTSVMDMMDELHGIPASSQKSKSEATSARGYEPPSSN